MTDPELAGPDEEAMAFRAPTVEKVEKLTTMPDDEDKPKKRKIYYRGGRPLDKDDPLMEIRRGQIEEVKELIDQNDVVVLGIAARTGNSSVMRSLETKRTPEEKKTVIRFTLEFTSVARIEQQQKQLLDLRSQYPDGEITLIVEESNNLILKNKRPEIVDACKTLFADCIAQRVKMILCSHDAPTPEIGGYAPEALVGIVNEVTPQGFKPDISVKRFETLRPEQLSQVFDIFAEEIGAPAELLARKQELIEMCTLPEQLDDFFSVFERKYKQSDDFKDAFEEATLIVRKSDELLDLFVRIFGKEKMWPLLGRVANNESLAMDDLSPEERELVQHTEPYHVFKQHDGRISINGTALEEVAKERSTWTSFE